MADSAKGGRRSGDVTARAGFTDKALGVAPGSVTRRGCAWGLEEQRADPRRGAGVREVSGAWILSEGDRSPLAVGSSDV